jgi:arsenate reductase
MAAAWFNQVSDPAKARAVSAGTQPADHVHPVVVEAMKEKGIDLSKAEPQRLTPELARGAAFLVTMGCGESCPYVPGVPILDWPLPDPKGQGIGPVRVIRDEVEALVRALVKHNAWG